MDQSTDIKDLVQSGRYKVARSETIEMIKAVQDPSTQSKHGNVEGMKDLKSYIIEQEGLEIGERRQRLLAQQWRFFLMCEPMQRGLDAGIIMGSITAAASAYRNRQHRIPARIGLMFVAGFCAGLLSVPLLVIASELSNVERIKAQERELFDKQRTEFKKK